MLKINFLDKLEMNFNKIVYFFLYLKRLNGQFKDKCGLLQKAHDLKLLSTLKDLSKKLQISA